MLIPVHEQRSKMKCKEKVGNIKVVFKREG